VPAFLFAEFDTPLDGSGSPDAAAHQKLYSYRDPLERALIARGCRTLKTQGRRLLAILEPSELLPALAQALRDIDASHPGQDLLPFKLAIHQGVAYQGNSGWFGPEIDHTHRLLDVIARGYPVLSEAAGSLPLPEGFHRMSLGMHMLKDLRPSEELFALHPVRLTRLDFDIPRSMNAYKHNLPAQATPFLGRQEAVNDLIHRFTEGDARMITLLGPGGFGKTRLALQASADLVDRFDGVFWIPLAPLTSEDRLISALADSIGVGFYKGEDPFQKVLEVLAERRCLLVFDNFEHLTSGRHFVARLLKSTQARVLVTSREALRVPEEKVVEVTGLRSPERPDDPLFEEHGATQLFISSLARAGRVTPLSPEERGPFVALCAQLHGMPLGIEMSAALTINHGLPEVVSQIRGRIDFLAVSLPHLPDRQKSTRAVFEYSWNLLDEPLRRALSRLSILRGTFDDEAAKQIARCDNETLCRLQERSLVMFLPDRRQLLHETVRYYAKEHLYEDPEDRRKTLEAHAKYYLTFLQNSLPLFECRDQRMYLEAASEQHENIQAAFLWSVENGLWEVAEGTLEAYAFFLDRLSKFQEGRNFLTQLLNALKEARVERREKARESLRAALLLNRATLAVRMGLNEGLVADLEECARVYQGKSFTRQRGRTLLILGQVLEALGRRAQSIDHLSHALAEFEASGDRNNAAYARNRIGQGLLQWGQRETAAAFAKEALSHYVATDNPSGMAWSRMLLGQIEQHDANYEEAKKHFREGLEGYLAVGHRDGVSWAMNMMAKVAKFRGDFLAAEQMLLEALLIEEEISNYAAQAWTQVALGEVEFLLGRLDKADKYLLCAWEMYTQMGDKAGETATLRWMGNLALARDEGDKAEGFFLDSEKVASSVEDDLGRAWHHYHLALVAHKRGRFQEARGSLEEAIATFERFHYRFGLAWATHLMAEIGLASGDASAARRYLFRSLRWARELRLPPILLEDWLVWAALLAAEGAVLEAAQWCEATIQNPARAWNTARKAKCLQEECERRLDPEERDMARRVAISADLDAWTDRILAKEPPESVSSPRRSKSPVKKKAKAKPSPKKPVSKKKKK